MDLVTDGLNHWHWLILGVVLMAAEMAMPGVFLLWIGLAGLVTGVIVAVASPGWEIQVLMFAALSVVSAIAGRQWAKKREGDSDHPMLNRRGQQYVGRTFSLAAEIVNGNGKITVDDTTWKVTGPDLPAGAKVRVTGVDGAMLTVEAAD